MSTDVDKLPCSPWVTTSGRATIAFKLIINVSRATTSIPETFVPYDPLEEARAGAKELIRKNPLVLRVMIITSEHLEHVE